MAVAKELQTLEWVTSYVCHSLVSHVLTKQRKRKQIALTFLAFLARAIHVSQRQLLDGISNCALLV